MKKYNTVGPHLLRCERHVLRSAHKAKNHICRPVVSAHLGLMNFIIGEFSNLLIAFKMSSKASGIPHKRLYATQKLHFKPRKAFTL